MTYELEFSVTLIAVGKRERGDVYKDAGER